MINQKHHLKNHLIQIEETKFFLNIFKMHCIQNEL